MAHRIIYRPRGLEYAHFRTLEEQCFPEEPMLQSQFHTLLKRDHWIVYQDTHPVGYGTYAQQEDLAWIKRIGVSSPHRRQGIGTQLLQTILDHCRTRGLYKSILYVQQDNQEALRLYAKHAFKRAGSASRYLVPLNQFYTDFAGFPTHGITASPLHETADSLWPVFSGQWADLPALHDPPRQYVLLFQMERTQNIGYCRLAPEFGGCFPLVVIRPTHYLPGALLALKPYLPAEKKYLKLTLDDPHLIQTCQGFNFPLDYKMYRMEKNR